MIEEINDSNSEDFKTEDSDDLELNQENIESSNESDALLRLQADFTNYRKRVSKEKIEIFRRSKESILLELLPVLDNFNRALQMQNQDIPKGFIEGIQMVEKQFYLALKKLQVEPIVALGKAFDPNLHEAVSYEQTDSCEEGIVFEELEKGYLCEGKVFRFTKVKVAKN